MSPELLDAAQQATAEKAENERLRNASREVLVANRRLEQACDIFEKNSADAIELEKARDAARAEVERLKALVKDCDRLNYEHSKANMQLTECNAGLRAALEDIANCTGNEKAMREHAREALAKVAP